MDKNPNPGLGQNPWMTYDPSMTPMQRLGVDQRFHDNIKDYLLKRIQTSEFAMSQFYPRWQVNERKVQAYMTRSQYEEFLKKMNDSGAPPSPVSITFPYAYATLWTVVTYLIHTFTGRRPIFQVSASKSESIAAAKNMELILQWNADATKMVVALAQHFMDGELYGVAIMRCLWKTETSMRSRWKQKTGIEKWAAEVTGAPTAVRSREEVLVFEGNEVINVDPFMFFPDPNVPMAQVNRKGEYVFWRAFTGKHELLKAESAGQIEYVERAATQMPTNQNVSQSARGSAIGADTAPNLRAQGSQVSNYYQVDQGSVVIIPKELGLSESTVPQKWLFTMLNKSQIVGMEQLDLEHDMHPVAVAEPTTMGYGFGQMSLVDYLVPLQDTMSWLLNSHMHNVRSVLNNSFVYNPAMVEASDLRSNEPGKLIRLKPAAFGQDPKMAVAQLAVSDVTRGHMDDLGSFMRIGDSVSAVSDNLKGMQDSGGRKTATEVRTAGEAGASRLAAKATMYSAQSVTDLTAQMSINIQANMSQAVYVSIVGAEGANIPINIAPDAIVGDFYYPVHDGTLPIDKVALVDVWKEIMMAVAKDPELRQKYSLGKIFEFTAKLGGAQNIESFKADVASPGQEMPADAVPLDQVPPSVSPVVNDVPA